MNTVTITFDGPRASGKTVLMRAIMQRLGLTAEINDPYNSGGRKRDEHTLRVPMSPETIKRLCEPEAANLGLATTAQLHAELQARAEVGGYAEYRTVDQ